MIKRYGKDIWGINILNGRYNRRLELLSLSWELVATKVFRRYAEEKAEKFSFDFVKTLVWNRAKFLDEKLENRHRRVYEIKKEYKRLFGGKN